MGKASQLGRSFGNAANFVDVSPSNDCVGVSGCTASPAGASPGRTRQGLALQAVESTTAAHSERVSQPLRLYRSQANHTDLANRRKPVFHLLVVKSGRGRAYARRPPTPPYGPFGIRRFLSTEPEGSASFVSCIVSPVDRMRTPLPPSRLPASTALAAGSPSPCFHPDRCEITRDSPLMTGSALRHGHRPRGYYGLC